MAIDYERLREDVMDFIGTAMAAFAPMAMIDVIAAQKASNEELLQIAKRYDFDIGLYYIDEEWTKAGGIFH